MAWTSSNLVRHSLSKFSNTHDAMLSTFEHTSVRGVFMSNELDLSVDSNWLNHLLLVNRIAITDGVIENVHI